MEILISGRKSEQVNQKSQNNEQTGKQKDADSEEWGGIYDRLENV